MNVSLTHEEIQEAVAFYLRLRGMDVQSVELWGRSNPTGPRGRRPYRSHDVGCHATVALAATLPVPIEPDRAVRTSVSPLVRALVYARDGRRCRYCGRDMPAHPCSGSHGAIALDHLLPVSRGGGNEADNLVVACMYCNSQKGSRTVEEYLAWLGGRAPAGVEHLDEGDPDDPPGSLAAAWEQPE